MLSYRRNAGNAGKELIFIGAIFLENSAIVKFNNLINQSFVENVGELSIGRCKRDWFRKLAKDGMDYQEWHKRNLRKLEPLHYR